MRTWCLILIVFMFGISISYGQNVISLKSFEITSSQPGLYNATYIGGDNELLRSRNLKSENNGKTWINQSTTVKKLKPPPIYGRRVPVSSIYDKKKNLFVTFFNALDNPNVNAKSAEPKAAQKGYYLRYRVSNDNSQSWLFDEQVISNGNYSDINPFDGIKIGTNAMYLGDSGSKPIVLSNGDLLLPVQATIAPDAKDKRLNVDNLFNPAGGYTYTEVLILRGRWNSNNRLTWELSARIKGDKSLTTRGLLEPTIIELNNGTILSIMRGSNGGKTDPNYNLGSYKWISYSKDKGKTWTKSQPWTYDNGKVFFSPSSMSVLFKHSNGKVYWVGNINKENSAGGKPRYPLVIGEVDQVTMKLKRTTLLTVDTLKDKDKGKGELDLGHVTLIEDKKSKEIILVYPRIFGTNTKREWATVRLSVE